MEGQRQVGHGARGGRAGSVASTGRGPVGRAGAYFKRLAAPRRRRFAKPPVMQGAPLPTRAPPEGKVERGAVVRPRAPPLHAPRLSEVPSVVLVPLLERWNSVAQVLRLQRDYFKLDN